MKLYSGVDLIEISRIKKSMKSSRFMARVFSAWELAEFEKRKFPPQTVAGHFAAKEAFAKAICFGIRGFSLNEVSLLHDSLGHPYFFFTGRAKHLVDSINMNFTVSISHTERNAVAFVVGYLLP